METSNPLDVLPIWGVYLFTVGYLFLAVEAGFRLGGVFRRRWPEKTLSGVGAMVGAALALLGFLLAFVTGIGVDLFNQRRHLVVSEANAIGTAYLQAGVLPEPYAAESRELLSEYVDQRLAALVPGGLQAAIDRSEQIHIELWTRGQAVARETPLPTVSMYLSSLNHLIDLHTERINAELGYRVPPTVLLGVFGVAGLTMVLLGVYESYGERRNSVAVVLLVLILALVFLLIVDLDRSNVGIVRVPQKALLDLQEAMQRLR